MMIQIGHEEADAMLCCAVLCHAMLCYAHAMLCYAMLCYAMLCQAVDNLTFLQNLTAPCEALAAAVPRQAIILHCTTPHPP